MMKMLLVIWLLGIGFSECIKGGIDMDKEELFEKGDQ